MALTGLTLIIACALATTAVATLTVVLWSRFGRWRLLSRTAGILLCEALVVVTVGLVANRQEQFYPSWQALSGSTGTASTTATAAAGRLDTSFGAGRSRLSWQPAGSAAWHLAGAAQVSVPAGYAAGNRSYPVLLGIGGHPGTTDLVGVVLKPTARSTAAALAALPAALAADVRVTGHGWALVTAAADAPLAAGVVAALPGRFASLVVVGAVPPGFRPPPGVAVAVVTPAPAPQRKVRHPAVGHPSAPVQVVKPVKVTKPAGPLPDITYLTGSWAAATAWAVDHTARPLAQPHVLPTAVVS